MAGVMRFRQTVQGSAMLEYLRIRDLALIEDMELEFGPGMNVLTGETGAGKTFILKAINFLLGEKLGGDMVRPGRERAQVEAIFLQPEGEVVLRRELLAESGRSRFFLNHDLSSQDAIRALRPSLMLHAGQHGQQRLLQPAYQSLLTDSFLGTPDLPARKEDILKKLRAVSEERHALLSRVETLRERRDLLIMQQQDIDRVTPLPGEEEYLENLRLNLRGAMRLQEQHERGLTLLHGGDGAGLLELAGSLERLLENLVPEEEGLGSALESVAGFRAELVELDRHFRNPSRAPSPEYDMETLEARLYALARLKRKLHRTLPEILALRSEIEENLSFLDACGLDLQRTEREERELAARLHEILERCNAQRHSAARLFCRALEKELAGLGFAGQVRVQAEFSPQEIWPALDNVPACLEDRVRLLWAPNPGQPSLPLDRIASGGELSRFLLAVIGLQAKNEGATLIFDEVDAGVGGITLNRVGERLSELASRRQMLLITHWPQLAARGERHFLVSKEVVNNVTYTRCRRLDPDQRSAELARMSGQE